MSPPRSILPLLPALSVTACRVLLVAYAIANAQGEAIGFLYSHRRACGGSRAEIREAFDELVDAGLALTEETGRGVVVVLIEPEAA